MLRLPQASIIFLNHVYAAQRYTCPSSCNHPYSPPLSISFANTNHATFKLTVITSNS